MHDDILCVIMRMATEQEAKQRKHRNTQRGQVRGWEKQQSSMRKPGIPPARIPEITESSRSGMTFTLALRSKHRQRRVATRVVRNGGETWSIVKNNSSSYGIQGALRVRSVILFQASSSLGAVVHSCGACCFQNCIQCDRVSDDR